MRRFQLRTRTALLGVAVLALGMGLGRSMYGRVTHCRERAEHYDIRANSMESQARMTRMAAGTWGDRWLWEEARRCDQTAMEHRELATWYRAAAWRPWHRLPPAERPGISVSDLSASDLGIVNCPADDTIVHVSPSAIFSGASE